MEIDTKNPDRIYSRKEAAEITGLSMSSISRLCKDIGLEMAGGSYVIYADSIRAILAARKPVGNHSPESRRKAK